MSSLKNTAMKTVANNIKKIQQLNEKNNGEDKTQSEPHEFKGIYHGATQEIVPVKNIKNGVIITDDGRYVWFLEVLPLNFYMKSIIEQKKILNSYGQLFTKGPVRCTAKIMSDIYNPNTLIYNAKKACKNQTDPKVNASLEDYIEFIKKLSETNSVTKRYFFIFEYSGSNGRSEKNENEIISSMYEDRNHYAFIIKNCGNACIIPENENLATAEFLYYFYNRKTSRKIPFAERYERILADYETYNEVTGKSKKPSYKDLIASKGTWFTNRNYIVVDGTYYTFIGVDGEYWPSGVPGGWIDFFSYSSHVDIDIINKKLPQELTKATLKQYNKLTKRRVEGQESKRRYEKAQTTFNRHVNGQQIYNKMEQGQELYNSSIILTIRADTEWELGNIKRFIMRTFEKFGVYFVESFIDCENWFKMTMPFLYVNEEIFSSLSHNVLSSQMESMYPYSSYEVNDPTGFVLGYLDNRSIYTLNNFNKNNFDNANILLLGKSGAGKTYTEQLMGGRMLMTGKRCFYIIPKKGYEYKKGCDNVGGSYIRFVPGVKNCINIMAIRPEGNIDFTMLDEDMTGIDKSLRAKKINSIIIWIQMLMGNDQMNTTEYNALSASLIRVYEKFGITDDNRTIYADIKKGILKEMPILGDLVKEISDNRKLERIYELLSEFIKGSCSNLNGQTNVDLDNEYIVFDVDEDIIGEKLLPSFMYMIFDFVYDEVKENPESYDAVFLDEVWKMMQSENGAKQVQNMIKLIRGYHGCTVIATQELEDFLEKSAGFGRSVLNNSEITILLSMKEAEVDYVEGPLKLSAEEKSKIIGFSHGRGMIITSRDRSCINIESTVREDIAFTH